MIYLQDNLNIVTIDGFSDVPENDEAALVYAVSRQPVSVGIEASSLDFQLYAGVRVEKASEVWF